MPRIKYANENACNEGKHGWKKVKHVLETVLTFLEIKNTANAQEHKAQKKERMAVYGSWYLQRPLPRQIVKTIILSVPCNESMLNCTLEYTNINGFTKRAIL